MLRSVQLQNFRTFKNFTTRFKGSAYLIGPNNAGKSTILTALRLADHLLRIAYARKPALRVSDEGMLRYAYEVSLTDFPALQQSLRNEFQNVDVRLVVTWSTGHQLIAVWPEPEPDEYDNLQGYFYLRKEREVQPTTPSQVRRIYPSLGVVPILGPVDQTEALLNPEYVSRNYSSRLSSRHFRNQLWLLQQNSELPNFWNFAQPWLPELGFDELNHYSVDKAEALSLHLTEQGSRVPKEISWIGDGMQIWLQILFHAYRLRDRRTIVLDEPDVYLHSDLQRRLVRFLESLDLQSILATHSPEIVAEAPRAQILWVDRSRRSTTAVHDEALLEQLTNTIGTQFNLKLARAMRAKVVVMVEGNDMQLLLPICKTIGAERVAHETGVAVISLAGYSHWDKIEPFVWLVKDFLQDSVKCYVVLDRDYRPQCEIDALVSRFATIGIDLHVWERKELESYLLCNPEALARIAKMPVGDIIAALDTSAASMANDVFSRMLEERIRTEKSASRHEVTIMSEFKGEFDASWADKAWRLSVCPPKQMLSHLNTHLQSTGKKALSFARIARELRAAEVPPEMRDLLLSIDQSVSTAANASPA